MKRRLKFLVLLFALGDVSLLPAPSAWARSNGFGAGVILGEPTGITAKGWLGGNQAVQGTLSYSFNDFLMLTGDYLIHFPRAFAAGRGGFPAELTPYVGPGLALFMSTDDNRGKDKYFTDDGSVGLGFRVPLGIEWQPSRVPLGIFAEIVPGVGIIPSTFGFVQGGLGIRYYFG